MIGVSAIVKDIIANAAKTWLATADLSVQNAANIAEEINCRERQIEQMCVRLLLHEQPVASDLRRITAAQKMITDMERIGDQGKDIADLAKYMQQSPVKSDVHIAEMARATIKMVSDSIDSFVHSNIEQAKAAIASDAVVDDLFYTIKRELVEKLSQDSSSAGDCLDLLMIAKYFERIGDHAQNIAEWVLYSLTGSRDLGAEEASL